MHSQYWLHNPHSEIMAGEIQMQSFQNEKSFTDEMMLMSNLNYGSLMGPANKFLKRRGFSSDPKVWCELHGSIMEMITSRQRWERSSRAS